MPPVRTPERNVLSKRRRHTIGTLPGDGGFEGGSDQRGSQSGLRRLYLTPPPLPYSTTTQVDQSGDSHPNQSEDAYTLSVVSALAPALTPPTHVETTDGTC